MSEVKMQVVKEGDRNSKFFHSVVNWQRQVNSLTSLTLNVRWVDQPQEVKREVKTFVAHRFRGDQWNAPNLDGVPLNQLSQEHEALTGRFDSEEVKEAVWECNGDKFPSLDGYNFKFIKTFWYMMAEDVCKVMDEFFLDGR